MRKLVLAAILVSYPLISLPAQRVGGTIAGRVTDPSRALVPGAVVTVRLRATGFERTARTDRSGEFRFNGVAAGEYDVTVAASGFAESRRDVRLRPGESREFDLELQLASLPQEVVVSAGQVIGSPEALQQIPGSVAILSAATLTEARVFNTDEALRKVSGVFTRGEEGFGLRPNIGIRGLNPTRSTKVLFLEDGVPLTYAPYGDNATYYHPPIDRFDSVEVVKGAGQILYGPMTVGGVINYITPPIPERPRGFLTLTGGNRSYLNGHFQYGGTWGRTGLLLDASRRQGAGARENLRTGINDLTGKIFQTLTPRQTLSFKVNFLNEDSNITYSGLTEDEYRANPRGNPFRNDFFFGRRFGASATYTHSLTNELVLTTNAYGSHFNRDWWRQSSNSGQRPNDSGDPACAGMENLHTTCGIEGRLRGYYLWGIEPRFRSHFQWGRVINEADFGFRAHFEDQDRQQENGPLPTSRDGVVVENNKRHNRAYSGFLQNRFQLGRVTLSPGVRLERVRYERRNRLNGAAGTTEITEAIPGFGIAYSPRDTVTIFAGVHRGFAPPRTEDIISNTGGSIDLDPELSWNYEVGVRTNLGQHGTLEATYFRMDYENQIIPASVAGGVGATLTSAGETLHEGLELGGRWNLPGVLGSRHGLSLRAGYTWIPTAEFVGTRFSTIAGFQQVSVTGNRLPYAARHLVNSGFVYSHPTGMTVLLEGNFTSQQFGDDLNTVEATPNGQRGIIPGNTVWNATLNVPLEAYRSTFFVTVKNLFDRTYIVDRTRGILPGMPRQLQGGLRLQF